MQHLDAGAQLLLDQLGVVAQAVVGELVTTASLTLARPWPAGAWIFAWIDSALNSLSGIGR
jgi:hypothetical protein